MQDLQQIISTLPVSDSEKAAILTRAGKQKDPKKAALILSAVIDKAEKQLLKEEVKLDEETVRLNREFERESALAEKEFNKTSSDLEEEAQEVSAVFNKQLDDLRLQDLKDDLAQ